jgi:NAD-dependent DNA ligase
LLAAFGSLQGVRDAAPEAIAALPGFGPKIAQRIVELLRSTEPTAPGEPVPAPASTPTEIT